MVPSDQKKKKKTALGTLWRDACMSDRNLVYNISDIEKFSVIPTAGVKFSSLHCSHCPEGAFDD